MFSFTNQHSSRLLGLVTMIVGHHITPIWGTKGPCVMEILRGGLKEPRVVELTLHESNFDIYQHVNATVYPDLVETAVANVIRSSEDQPAKGPSYRVKSLAIQYRMGIPLRTLSVKTTLSLGEGAAGSPTQTTLFKIGIDENVYASGSIELTNKEEILPTAELQPERSSYGDPILYTWDLPVLNNDRNPNYQVSPARILDGVFTSRWYALKSQFKVTADDWVRRGLGFFLTKAEMHFIQPRTELGYLTYTSWVSEVSDHGRSLVIPYQVRDKETGVLYSQGTLQFAAVDLSQERPRKQSVADWALACLFK